MVAYVAQAPGNAELVDAWSPRPAVDNGIRVKVEACGLNFADLLMITGEYQDTPSFPFVPGMEVCGTVLEPASGLNVGDRIVAYCGSGGLAREAVIDSFRCLKVPDGMPSVTAAGFQIAYGTSHLALTRRARLSRGETLVVLGAAGGVGLTAVEIGKALGARVIAVARSEKKRAIAESAGADISLDAESPDLLQDLRDLGGVDVVYDAVGGALGEAAMRALRPEGRFLIVGFASGAPPKAKLNHVLVKNIELIGYYWGGYMAFQPETLMESSKELLRWYQQGRITPHISHVLPIEQISEGLDLLRQRKATGKVVITL